MNKQTQQLEGEGDAKHTSRFALIVTADDAQATPHASLYSQKELMIHLPDIAAIAEWMQVSAEVVREQLRLVDDVRLNSNVVDTFGRVTFGKHDFINAENGYYVGWITPALHYTMGGL